MADSLHNALGKFRNTMLTAVACLEFELRDSMKSSETDMRIDTIMSTLNEVSEAVSNLKPVSAEPALHQFTMNQVLESSNILNITPPLNTKNVVVSKSTTPALTAAVAAFNPPSMALAEEMEVDEDATEEEEEEEEADVDEDANDGPEEDEEEELEVEEFEFKGVTYQRDADNNVYLDGEEVGIWNGKKIIPSV